MIKSIIFIAAYLLLIPAILAQDSLSDDTLPDQNSDPLLLNQKGDNTVTQATTKPQVTIYTASYCSYCVKAKDLLAKKGIDFTVVDVTDPATRTDMIAKSGGRRTVPQIFIEDEQGEQHIGGYDDLKRIMNDPHRVNNNPFDKLFQPYPYDRNDLKQIMNNSSTRKD